MHGVTECRSTWCMDMAQMHCIDRRSRFQNTQQRSCLRRPSFPHLLPLQLLHLLLKVLLGTNLGLGGLLECILLLQGRGGLKCQQERSQIVTDCLLIWSLAPHASEFPSAWSYYFGTCSSISDRCVISTARNWLGRVKRSPALCVACENVKIPTFPAARQLPRDS